MGGKSGFMVQQGSEYGLFRSVGPPGFWTCTGVNWKDDPRKATLFKDKGDADRAAAKFGGTVVPMNSRH